MAGDWIKMRTSLLTNPKVNGIARELECSSVTGKALSNGYGGAMSEIVTRAVMRHVTVSSLLVVWGAANEHTHDGVFHNADLSDIDDMTGIPGFGEALAVVGWAVYDQSEQTVTLPNFNEYNTSGSERSAGAKSAAERQKAYRERQKSQISDVTSDVTNDVTSNRREEKRREEEIHTSVPDSDVAQKIPTAKQDPIGFTEFWETWPSGSRKQAKGKCLEAWKKAHAEAAAAMVKAHVESLKDSASWKKNDGEFIPAPLVYLNKRSWEGAEIVESSIGNYV